MAIVGGQDLRSFMSDPHWTEAQAREADKLCARLEQSLGDALGAPIDPIPWTETADVLIKGLVATRYPVARVTEIGGVEVAEDATVLPEPWFRNGHWVRIKAGRLPPASVTTGATRYTSTELDGLAGLSGFGGGLTYAAAPSPVIGHVDITYMGGWGRTGTLELAVLRKAEAIFGNRNTDTVTITTDGTTPTRLPRREPEFWTKEELESDDLQLYRNLHIHR